MSFPERFQGNVNSDFVSEFETIGNRLSRGIHLDLYSIQVMNFDSEVVWRWSEPDAGNSSELQFWQSCAMWNGNPEGMWKLGGEIVNPQSGKQANDKVGLLFNQHLNIEVWIDFQPRR